MTIDLKEIITWLLSIVSAFGVVIMGLLAFFGKRTLNQATETMAEQDKRLRVVEGNYIIRTELTGAINRVTDSIEKHNDKMEGHINRIEAEVRKDLKDMSTTIHGLTTAIIERKSKDD